MTGPYTENLTGSTDALDLDAALTRGAHELKALGSSESLDVRRSLAAGDLARRQLALDLDSPQSDAVAKESGTADQRSGGGRPVKPRQVVLYVHLSETAITGTITGTGTLTGTLTGIGTAGCLELARVENRRRGVTADQVRTWCANPQTTVVVKPVIDLNEHVHVEAYEVPDRLREQSVLVNHHCVFPHCTRPARSCDADHCQPHDRGGATCSANIAPLCRRHHRLKTHTAWIYTVLEPGSYLWTSPHGYTYLRDHTGTTDLSSRGPNRYPGSPGHPARQEPTEPIDPDPPEQ